MFKFFKYFYKREFLLFMHIWALLPCEVPNGLIVSDSFGERMLVLQYQSITNALMFLRKLKQIRLQKSMIMHPLMPK